MAWKYAVDPKAPTPPREHHVNRCMNCGHLEFPDLEKGINESHDSDVGCLVEGGTKYIEDDEGNNTYACSCKTFVPSPERSN